MLWAKPIFIGSTRKTLVPNSILEKGFLFFNFSRGKITNLNCCNNFHEWGSPELGAQNSSSKSYQLDWVVKCQTMWVKQNWGKWIPKYQIKTRDSKSLPGEELLIVVLGHWVNRKSLWGNGPMSPKGGFNQAKHPLKGETIGLVEEGSVRKITSRTHGWGFPAHAFLE